ncbi:MAG: protein kinase [Deltaproteobacteria bacterium]|nr:protein kinase [Deltaproteobacteria bacterium]
MSENLTLKPHATANLVGQVIGHFRVVDRLGEGGMGVVYRAEDMKLRRPVALKVMPPEIARNPELRARFLREARALAAATHPNIAAVYEVDESGELAFLAMELVEGQTLRHVLADGPLELNRALTIAREVARGLERAHAAGVIHRDLKPDNVMVAPDGSVKLLDFGLAKQEVLAPDELTNSGKTLDGQLLGTPGYMAPEQALGRAVDARADLFALGVMLFELLTGERPFGGETVMERVMAVVHEAPRDLNTLNVRVPPDVEHLVLRCLQRQPELRPQSAGEVVGALGAAIDGRRISVRIGPSLAEDDDGNTALSVNTRRRKRLVRLASAALAIVVVALCGARLAMVYRSQRAPTTLVDLPLPDALPPARDAFGAGMSALHDGDWLLARKSFTTALQADPELAAAHLRLALIDFALPNRGAEAREELKAATQRRARLTPRDELLRAGLEPLIERDPPDFTESGKRFAAASLARPGDAELHFLRGWALQGHDWPAALEAVSQATAIDPAYADALQLQSAALAALGRTEEAVAPLDLCEQRVPAATDCVLERLDLHTWNGQCALAEADARLANARQPSAWIYTPWAEALLAQGRPREAAEALFAQELQNTPAEQRPDEDATLHIHLALLEGRFGDAAKLSADSLTRIANRPDYTWHARFTALRVGALEEMGELNQAADAAQDFLVRKDAWVHDSQQFDHDITPWLWEVQKRAGRLSAADVRARRDAYLATPSQQLGISAAARWLSAWGPTVDTLDDARAALSNLPPGGVTAYKEYGLDFADQAHVRRIAGDVAGALPLLRRVAASCRLLDDPLRRVRFELELGQALRATGDEAGACAQFADVVRRWGDASPRSVTAEQARAELKSCK